MPLLETKGAASAQGFGLTLGGAAPTYIEDVFSTWLYTGNSSTQTITNGIDLSTKGGLVWIKSRSAALNHQLFDTARGATNRVNSNTSDAQSSDANTLTAFTSSGFNLGSGGTNLAPETFASWTFRKQPKFFDVVTYTGDGNYSTDTPSPYGRAIAHSLTSRPGFIVIKATSASADWYVGARQDDTYWRGSNGTGTNAFRLNGTGGATLYDWANKPMADANSFFPAQIGAGGSSGTTNDNGVTYVAYLFAHNAGGFGLTGTDNVISCGSFTAGTGEVNLGYEPQWIVFKSTTSTGGWVMFDTMRGWVNSPDIGGTQLLQANTSGAEGATGLTTFQPTATGFKYNLTADYIYIAIRRGPMKTPTSGTSVFNPVARTGTGTNPTVVTTNNNPDLLMSFPRTASPSAYGMCFWDKLRGISPMLQSATTGAEISTNTTRVLQGWLNTGYQAGADFAEGYLNYSGSTYINYTITRAPGFFDVVCYTGTGSARTVSHNLGVAPELIITKMRSSTRDWGTGWASLGWTARGPALNSTETSFTTSLWWNNTAPTTSVFTVGTSPTTNGSGDTYVAYLFASCPGVSKVGSYTGTGALQTINCGFTGGARFVLIKRTDSTGDWFTYDSARGISSGNDPYLLMNSTAAEVTGTNYVDTTSVGFQVTAAAPAGLNASGGTYIFLAIA